MNENVEQQDQAGSAAAIAPQQSAAPEIGTTSRPKSGLAAWLKPWPIIAALALGLAIWQWVETRIRLSDTQVEIARRLSESDTQVKESRVLARQAQEQLAVLQGKLGELEGKLAESRSQQATLEALYQDLARNRDEWALAEV